MYGKLYHMFSRKQNVKNCCFAFGCFCSLKDKGGAEPSEVSPAVAVAVAWRGTTEDFKTPAVCLAPSLSCPAVWSSRLASRISCAYKFGEFFANYYCHSNVALWDCSNNSCNSSRPVPPSPLFLTSPRWGMRILRGMAAQAKGILPSVQGLELKIKHSSLDCTAPHLETLVCELSRGALVASLELQVTLPPSSPAGAGMALLGVCH